MKRFKTTHFRILSMVVLFAGLTFTSCKDSLVSSFADEEEMELATYEGNDLMSNNTVSYNLIETLDVDARLVGNPAGPAFSTNILESGVVYRITVDGNWSAWPADWWVGGDEKCSRFAVKYKSPSVPNGLYAGFDAEGRYASPGHVGSQTPCGDDLRRDAALLISLDGTQNYSNPTPLDIAFNPDHIYEYEVTGTGQKVAFYIPDTNEDNHGVFKVTIEKVVENTAPETNVYISDNTTDTYDPLFPATADPAWQTSVCYKENSFGINATWSNPHKAFEVGTHPWEPGTFDAKWINASPTMESNKTVDENGNSGPNGFNWTRYDKQVAGNGDFVVQLLADNCSWVYLADENGNSPKLIAFQGDDKIPGEYGVSLDGNHTLIFFIFNGGSLTGGKFRLETTESFGGAAPDPIETTNQAPVANAGGDQTLDATGPTTPVTLDGSGSSDPDGDALSYLWTLDGDEVATSETAVVDLAKGSYTFILTVSDGELSDTDEVNVTVLNTIPVADAGGNQTLEATGPTTEVTLDGSGSTDADGDKLSYSWSIDDDEITTGVNPTVSLGLGTHVITLTVDDNNGGVDSDDVTIIVRDTTDPELFFTVVTTNLWPPNHEMVLVGKDITASDAVDSNPQINITVSSNESANGRGDGNTDQDYEIVENANGSFDVYVRAERSGRGTGRTYTIDISAADFSGNKSTDSFEVSVAQNQGRGR